MLISSILESTTLWIQPMGSHYGAMTALFGSVVVILKKSSKETISMEDYRRSPGASSEAIISTMNR